MNDLVLIALEEITKKLDYLIKEVEELKKEIDSNKTSLY